MLSDKAKLAREWLFTNRPMTTDRLDVMYCLFTTREIQHMTTVREIISEMRA